MSNKTQLQTNNTDLQSLIDRINAAKDTAASLPEAGGGGSLETCTVTIIPESPGIGRQVYYVNGNQELVNESLKMAILTITCIKKSIIYVSGSVYASSTVTGEASKLVNDTIFVAGDATVVINS